jgi:hypothetical protein
VDFQVDTVDVQYLYRHGQLIAFGLSDNDIYSIAPTLRHDDEKEVIIKHERVGNVCGQVFDWTKRGGHSFNPKIHWYCPNCGQQWFADFTGSMPNPVFEASGCACVPNWFVHWDAQQVQQELAK